MQSSSGSDDEEFLYTEDSDGPNSDGASSPEPGDYSARLDEILSDEGGYESAAAEDDDDEAFLYTGKDASEVTGGYREQLKDVLDGDHDALGDDNRSLDQQQSLDAAHDRDEWIGHDSSYFTAVRSIRSS